MMSKESEWEQKLSDRGEAMGGFGEESPVREESEAELSSQEEPSQAFFVAEEGEESSSEDATLVEDGPPEEGQGEKRGFFSKKNKKDIWKEKYDELQDKYTRQFAEFDNYRKRTDKEKQQMFDHGAAHILTKILPVIDNFERGLSSLPEEERDLAFADGMNKIYKQLLAELEKLGVTPIEAVGQDFDPAFHNAVLQVESGEYESGKVAQEMLKGYMYKDTVLRHSMVGVEQ